MELHDLLMVTSSPSLDLMFAFIHCMPDFDCCALKTLKYAPRTEQMSWR